MPDLVGNLWEINWHGHNVDKMLILVLSIQTLLQHTHTHTPRWRINGEYMGNIWGIIKPSGATAAR